MADEIKDDDAQQIDGGVADGVDDVSDLLVDGEAGDKDVIVDDDPKETGTANDDQPPPVFTLPDDDPADKGQDVADGEDGDDFVDIVHNGQVHKITKEKMIELAQKGFDYDSKVGPHGKIAQMINTDPELTKMVDDYWRGKVKDDEAIDNKFKVLSMDDYETEELWMQANMQSVYDKVKKDTPEPAAPQPKNDESSSVTALRARDPENFERVYSKLSEYAEKLTVKDYRKVDSDLASLCKFYDFVKEQEGSKKDGGTSSAQKKPGFRVKSGGGDAPSSKGEDSPAWKLSKKDFQKQLDKIKGYA